MSELSEHRDSLDLLFKDEAGFSDSTDGDEDSPTLVNEQYVRTPQGVAPKSLNLSLVNSRHSLWGHRLWNAALVLAEMIDRDEIAVEGRTVLELGAGAGLPGLICALRGSRTVVISDYATSSDQALMVPIRTNIDRIEPAFVPKGTLHAIGHVWGHPVEDLLAPLHASVLCSPESSPCHTQAHPENSIERQAERGMDNHVASGVDDAREPPEAGDEQRQVTDPASAQCRLGVEASRRTGSADGSRVVLPAPRPCLERVQEAATHGEPPPPPLPRARSVEGGGGQRGFDMLILADLLFNRSQHSQLLATCCECLGAQAGAEVWVSFSHHDPEKTEQDMKFFELARARGLATSHLKTVQRQDLFVENDGKDVLRGAVHIWRLTRAPPGRTREGRAASPVPE